MGVPAMILPVKATLVWCCWAAVVAGAVVAVCSADGLIVAVAVIFGTG